MLRSSAQVLVPMEISSSQVVILCTCMLGSLTGEPWFAPRLHFSGESKREWHLPDSCMSDQQHKSLVIFFYGFCPFVACVTRFPFTRELGGLLLNTLILIR